MNFFEGFIKGISSCFKAFGIVFGKGFWPYLFYPLIAWVILWIGTTWLFLNVADSLALYLTKKINLQAIPDSGSWLSFAKPFLTGYFSVIIAILLKIIFWFISGTLSKYLVLILLSPLFSLLSESTEEKINGRSFPFSWTQFIKDILRGIGISLRNLCIEYLFIISCFGLTLFFPPLAMLTIPFLLLVSWYYIGFTMLDYSFERHDMGITESTLFTRKNKGIACGIGFVYSVCMLLPFFVGIMFGPVIAIIGSTLCFLEIKQPFSHTDSQTNTI